MPDKYSEQCEDGICTGCGHTFIRSVGSSTTICVDCQLDQRNTIIVERTVPTNNRDNTGGSKDDEE